LPERTIMAIQSSSVSSALNLIDMWRYFKLVCIVLTISIFCSSCFQIEEVIRFKEKESGTVEYMIDLSSMMDMVKMLGQMSDSAKSETPEASTMLANSFGEVKTQLEKIAGISNVVQVDDTDNSRFGIRADFANIKALNTALSLLYDVSDNKEDHTYYEFVKLKKNTYEYLEPIDIRANIEKSLALVDAENSSVGGIDPMMFFNDLSISSKLIFDNKTVKNSKNAGAVVKDDTVELTSYPFRKESTTTLKNSITVK
jgi:hypothetical protein